MRDITLLIAHPDDEALFLWPFLDRTKRIICMSDDSENPERVWCRERGKCLEEVGQLIGCEIIHLPYNSEFYRLPTRDGQLKRLADTVLRLLSDAEILATHNAFGEYGNLDHLIAHHVARVWQARTACELLVTDIAVTEHPAWLPIAPWSQKERPLSSHDIDRPLYDRIKRIYDARGCWTWAWEPTEKCRVYSL